MDGASETLGPGDLGFVRPPSQVNHKTDPDGPVTRALVLWAPGGEGARIVSNGERFPEGTAHQQFSFSEDAHEILRKSESTRESRMTESEELFQRFCRSRGWCIQRIDQHSAPHGTQVPDFYLRPARGACVVVEVKQFDPNPEERDHARRQSDGEVVVYGTTPGKRLRKAISKADKQLKAFARAEPGILVVYNRTVVRMHDDPYAVLTAMRGLDVIDVHVPEDPALPLVSGPVRAGPGKRMTSDWNTSVSCIAVLREFWADPAGTTPGPEYALVVYHNEFAKHALDPSQLVGDHVTHYRMNEEQTDWQSIP